MLISLLSVGFHPNPSSKQPVPNERPLGISAEIQHAVIPKALAEMILIESNIYVQSRIRRALVTFIEETIIDQTLNGIVRYKYILLRLWVYTRVLLLGCIQIQCQSDSR